MRYPAGEKTTKTLNTGITVPIPAATILGINLYISNTGSTSPLFLQNASPIGSGFTTFTGVVTTSRHAPVTNTAGIQAPTVAITDSAVAGGAIPVGTYTVGYTFVTNIGETTISPTNTVTTTPGNQSIQIFSGTAIGSSANSGYVTLELIVPNLEDWHVTRLVLLSDAAFNVPGALVYVDSKALPNLLDGTNNASIFSALHDTYLRPGQRLLAFFFMGDANSNATLSVYGEKTS